MSRVLKFSDLSRPRQALVRLCQRMNFGQIQSMRVRNADPQFEPRPVVLVDEKLDGDNMPRPEAELSDFALPAELSRLMARLDQIRDGTIERLEVRAGVPRRVVFESTAADFLPLEIKT